MLQPVLTVVLSCAQIGFLSTGHFDSDIYSGSSSRYDGYVTSIGTKDMDEVRTCTMDADIM